jgi:hypothetical protein
MGACYAFLLVVVTVGPERMNHDVILRDRHKNHHSSTDGEEKNGHDPNRCVRRSEKGPISGRNYVSVNGVNTFV